MLNSFSFWFPGPNPILPERADCSVSFPDFLFPEGTEYSQGTTLSFKKISSKIQVLLMDLQSLLEDTDPNSRHNWKPHSHAVAFVPASPLCSFCCPWVCRVYLESHRIVLSSFWQYNYYFIFSWQFGGGLEGIEAHLWNPQLFIVNKVSCK